MPENDLPKDSIILISGLNGYIASHLAVKFLQEGYTVRGTIRTQEKGDQWKALYPQYADRIQIAVVPDIQDEHAFDKCLKGVTVFCHIATLVPPSWISPGREYNQQVIDTAIHGTMLAMKAAAKTPSVKKVILTSSVASNMDFSANPGPNHRRYDETTWNQIPLEEALSATALMMPYSYGKMVSEKQAWQFMEDEKPQFKFVTVLPSYTFGAPEGLPGPISNPVVGTNNILAPVFDPKSDLNALLGGCNTVDIRDATNAHYLAATTSGADGKRIVLAQPGKSFYSKYIKLYNEKYPNKEFAPIPENFVEPTDYIVDGSSYEKYLGAKYVPFEQHATDAADYYFKVTGK